MAARRFYGWTVVWATFVALGVVFGTAYSFAAFFDSFAREFAAQRADVALVFGLSGLTYFVLGAAGGALSDRFRPRLTTSVGMLILVAGLVGSSYARSLLVIYLCYGLGIGLGIALVYTPSIGSVQPWFARRRGLASGIASAGIGAGTLLVPVAASWLIDSTGWREGMRTMALAAALVGLAATLLLERDPARRGVGPDGDAPAARALSAGSALSGMTLRQALARREFWLLYLSLFAGSPSMFTPFAHLSAHARDIGVTDARAVALVGLIGTGSLIGRFGIGWLADRLGRMRTLVLCQLLLGASFALWFAAPGFVLLAAYALIFGLFYGGLVSLLPPLCMDLFGGRAVSAILGALYTAAAFGNLAGPVLAGAAFDRTGNYTIVMFSCAVCSALAAYAAWRLWASARRVDT